MASDSKIEQAARVFLDAYRAHKPIATLPEEMRPATLDEAYAIQAAYAEICGKARVGYKVGAASAQSQALVAADGPFLGRLFEGTVFKSPARIPRGLLFNTLAEAELGFVIGENLAPRPGGYSRDEIADHIASVHPIVEICDHRFVDWRSVGVLQLIADNAFYGAMVVGDAIEGWAERDLSETHVAMSVGGQLRSEGYCRPVLGDPINGVAWVASELSRQGRTLEAGSLVAIGTWTGLHAVGPSETVDADYGAFGHVTISFDA
jgi:2-keto-4-pentenoate hydratase